MFESEIEGKAIELSVGRLLYINWGLLVVNIFGPPVPALPPRPGLMQGKHGRFAAVLEKRVFLFLE